MIGSLTLMVLVALWATHAFGESGTFNAVVVEYSPPIDPTLDPLTNFLNNVDNYLDFVYSANDKVQADIIVFPEGGLQGVNNQEYFVEVPDPKDQVQPCTQGADQDSPLLNLSCVARSTATYIVVNLGEKYFNNTQNQTLYFNTDVVFDRQGVVIARYRKIHLFMEGKRQQSLDKALVYFDTDFGVRFGLFTCFDIIFKDPGLVLAKEYNVTHFIFLSGWMSEMPFLTAIQEQYYWAYTLDVVLLASGFNMPFIGSTGTGIYQGRRGPVVYNMVEMRSSFMLYAQLPKIHSGEADNSDESSRETAETKKGMLQLNKIKGFPEELKLKRDYLDVYSTELITVPENSSVNLNGKDITVAFPVKKQLCHNQLCCNFTLDVILEFGEGNRTVRRDDYAQVYYRMAAFDGVRSYDHVDTGGLQTCAIIPCVNDELPSCGLTALDPSAKPKTFLNFTQKKFIFQNIKITGNFSNNNSFVGPNVLIGGEYDNFGALLSPDSFSFTENNSTEAIVSKTFQTLKPVGNLVTASLYARLFNRDGQDYTGDPGSQSSSGYTLLDPTLCLTIMFIILYLSSNRL